MNKLSPLVSIITPAYNAEKYIAEAIESVIDQSYTNWELIIINDGSSDSTEDIIKSFRDSRIKLINQSNGGVSSARNRGLKIARGEYITFLDADDKLPQNSIKVRVEYLLKYLNIDAVHGVVSIRDNSLEEELKTYKPFDYPSVLDKALRLDSKIFFNPCYMVRYSKIGDTRFKEGMTHCEDIFFLITLFSNNITYASLSETVYHYRVFKSSAMSNMEGLIKGYFELIDNVMKMPSISYFDTVVMRFKIMRVLISWYVRNKNFAGFKKVFKVFR
ncbi:MAG: glycosyltransferase family A protein [Sulfurovum sp.]